MLAVSILAGCQSTSSSIGVKSKELVSRPGSTIDVLDTLFADVVDLVLEAGSVAYKDVKISRDGSTILISDRFFWAGNAQAEIIQFKKFVDCRDDRDPFLGIWESDAGEYTLGLVRTDSNPRYKYQMFILASKYKNWEPGEVKLKFSRLDEDGLAVSKYGAFGKIMSLCASNTRWT